MSVRRKLTALFLAAACVFALAVGNAGAAKPGVAKPAEVTIFPNRPCFGDEIAAAPSGVFVRACDKGHLDTSAQLENLLPDGNSTSIAIPASQAGPIVAGPAGEVWVGANETGLVDGQAVGIERIGTDGSAQSFPLALAKKVERRFRGLVVDGQGNLWAAIGEPWKPFIFGGGHLSSGGQLLRIAPDGIETHFRLPDEIEPQGLAIGPEGDVWFTAVGFRLIEEHEGSSGVGFVGRLDPAGQMKLFRTPIRYGRPSAIALGPEGRLWFDQPYLARIGRISTAGRFGREIDLPVGQPWFANLAFGPEGDLWTLAGTGLLRMTPAGGQTVYAAPTATRVVPTADGAVWALEERQVRRLVP